MREERMLGLLCLGEKKRETPFSAEERELLDTLCNQMALAVENARLVEQRLDLERRMYEAERLSALGLLSASIAHEVKNPLSSIKTIAAVLREDLRDDRAKTEDLSIILSEIDRLNRTVERLLRFARPRQETVFRPLVLKEVLDDIILVLAHEAERRGVAIRSEVGEQIVVSGDLEDLKEVFFNLILNGIQAMEGGGKITLTARWSKEPRSRAAGH
ncbi:MAG: GAF domain-containing sensor histidine kinase [Candidatus Latescibacteria bacterium]|nr:GAF domain-containing sensor histidine kinase [Candidatus Latescibacterota bacterium]